MIPDAEVQRRAQAWAAGLGRPAGDLVVLLPTPVAVDELAVVFLAHLQGDGAGGPTLGGAPVVIDRRNGAITPLGTNGPTPVLFADYLTRHQDSPPAAEPDPPPGRVVAASAPGSRRGRPTRRMQPTGDLTPPSPQRPGTTGNASDPEPPRPGTR